MSFWIDASLLAIASVLVAFTLFPFSPMTLLLYMPSRESMLRSYRFRHFFRGLGMIAFSVLFTRVKVGLSPVEWYWAGGLALGFFFAFYHWAYVPVIMHAPKVRHEFDAQGGDSAILPDEKILGLFIGGQAFAYSVRDLTRPHVVRQSFEGDAISLTYCVLCNSAIGFRGGFDDKPLDLRPITAFNNNVLFLDRNSGNFIQQLDGRVIFGPNKGQQLEQVPVSITQWKSWRDAYPSTKFVELPAHRFREKLMTVLLDWMIPLPVLSRRNKPLHPVRESIDRRLPAMEKVLGISYGGQHQAYSMEWIREQVIINDRIGHLPIAIFYDQKRDLVSVFSRNYKGRILHFRASTYPGQDTFAIEKEKGTRWNLKGEEYFGQSPTGSSLEPLPHYGKIFWFSWSSFKQWSLVKAAS